MLRLAVVLCFQVNRHLCMGNTETMSGKCLPGRAEEEKLSNVHYVLKSPYKPPFPKELEQAVFATGCYWGTEKGYWKLPGVVSTAIGYAGGQTPNPTYREVCSGQTGHTEAVFVVYDPKRVTYADLLRMFYESHDPSQVDGQGNDQGTQYRSAIYTFNPEQMALAQASKAAYEKLLGKRIATEIKPMEEAGPFYYGHEDYQQYLARPGARPYCSAQPQGVSLTPASWVPAELQEKYAPKLPDAYWTQYGPKPGCTIKGPNEPNKWPQNV